MTLPPLTRGLRIYDILKQAGMSLTDWPHANDPSRNQNWAWLEGDIAVVNLWIHNLIPPLTPSDTYTARYVARGQNAKGDKIDLIYQEIVRKNMQVRVILKDKVSGKRCLDTEFWSATYDARNGELSLVRGEPLQFEDQHGEISFPDSTGSRGVYKRDSRVRHLAMKRSGGKCELCRKEGFVTFRGTIFAEVHHITPLSEYGKDSPDNVIVLCPDDHRRAHHSRERDKLKEQFQTIRKQDL